MGQNVRYCFFLLSTSWYSHSHILKSRIFFSIPFSFYPVKRCTMTQFSLKIWWISFLGPHLQISLDESTKYLHRDMWKTMADLPPMYRAHRSRWWAALACVSSTPVNSDRMDASFSAHFKNDDTHRILDGQPSVYFSTGRAAETQKKNCCPVTNVTNVTLLRRSVPRLLYYRISESAILRKKSSIVRHRLDVTPMNRTTIRLAR